MSGFDEFMIEETVKKNQEIYNLRDEKTELRNCLIEAIEAIQIFHGPGWELYRDHSPEMRRWRAALAQPANGGSETRSAAQPGLPQKKVP